MPTKRRTIIVVIIIIAVIAVVTVLSYTVTFNRTDNTTNANFAITQQNMYNLNQTLRNLQAKNYVVSLSINGPYTFIDSNSSSVALPNVFVGDLLGKDKTVTGYHPGDITQIQMVLHKVKNFTVSRDFRTISYEATFVDETNKNNLTGSVSGKLNFQNPIPFDKPNGVQNALPDKSTMNITLGSTLITEVKKTPSPLKVNQIFLAIPPR